MTGRARNRNKRDLRVPSLENWLTCIFVPPKVRNVSGAQSLCHQIPLGEDTSSFHSVDGSAGGEGGMPGAPAAVAEVPQT